MPNIYIHPNNGRPKVWARRRSGECVFGSLFTARQVKGTQVTEDKKQAEGYVYIASASWDAIQVVLMGESTSDLTVAQEASTLANELTRQYGSGIRVSGRSAQATPPPPAPAAPPVSTPKPAPAAKAKPKTNGAAIAEFAASRSDDQPEHSAWSW